MADNISPSGAAATGLAVTATRRMDVAKKDPARATAQALKTLGRKTSMRSTDAIPLELVSQI